MNTDHVEPSGEKPGFCQKPGFCAAEKPGFYANTLILGVGNPLCGDDGVGPRVIEMLRALPPERALPAAVQVQDAGLPGWGLPSWLEGWQTVFLVDAVEMNLAPGCWQCFDASDVQLWLQDKCLSLHQPDLACGLALSQALNLLPEQLYIYGVQPGDTTPGSPPSPEVNACLPELVEQIIHDLGKIQNDPKANPHC